MTKKAPSYTDALREIEAILARLDGGQTDVDQLGEAVARASELIALCREKLRAAEENVARVLPKSPEA